VETSRRYGLLINNPDFPQGYGAIRGILEATRNIRALQNASLQEKVRAVLDHLYEFQYGVFTLGWDSYHVSDAMSQCARVAADPESTPDRIAEAGSPLINSYRNLFKDSPTQDLPERTTTIADLTMLVQLWCQAWQRYIQRRLYGGRGLNYAIGQLKMQQYA
jgi:hypothetical protein